LVIKAKPEFDLVDHEKQTIGDNVLDVLHAVPGCVIAGDHAPEVVAVDVGDAFEILLFDAACV